MRERRWLPNNFTTWTERERARENERDIRREIENVKDIGLFNRDNALLPV